MRNYDTTSMPVRTVDGESLSKIAIHEVKKWKFTFSPTDGITIPIPGKLPIIRRNA